MEKLKFTDLEHVTPESVGIKSSAITAFVNEINAKGLGVQSFTVVRHNKVCAQGFWKPYSAQHPHVLYSMSKSFTSTAVGLAISDGLISLTDKIAKFFPEYKIATLGMNKDITVENLLTMRSGKLITFADEKGNKDWVKSFFAAPFFAKPGTKFNYISENTFMLSAIVSKVTGMSMLDYLYQRVLAPLGIEKPFWETDGKGNNAAGWGLYMKSEDLAKFFIPYINEGKWLDGTQLLPADYVKAATSKQTDTVKDGFLDYMVGYGYQFWRNPVENSYRADGLFGQRCFMFPDYDALVVMNCGQSEDYEAMKVFWNHFPHCFEAEALPENEKDYAKMLKTLDGCEVVDLPMGKRNPEMEKKINNRPIHCRTNQFTSMISISVLNMLYDKPGKINQFRFNFKEDYLEFSWREKNEENTVKVGLNGEYMESEIQLKSLHYHVFAKAAWQEDGSIKVWLRPIETAHVRKYQFIFKDNNDVRIINESEPNFPELTLYYLTFMGMPAKGNGARGLVKGAVKNCGLPILEPNIYGHLE